MNTQERTILFFACGSHFLTHFYILVFPALVMPISRDLGLPLADVVNISFTMYLLYGLLAVPWGFLSDRLNHRWAMAFGMIIAGVGLVLAGTVKTPLLMTAAFTLVGVGCASYHPSGMALISQGISQRGRALGINGIWGNIGIAAAPFAVGWFQYLIGWQLGVAILGCVGVVIGIGILVARIETEKGVDKAKVDVLESSKAMRLFGVFAIGMVFSGLMYRTYTLVLPSYLEFRLGDFIGRFQSLMENRFSIARGSESFQTLVANLVATVIYVIGIAGQATGGRVADRFSLKWSYFVYFCTALPFALLMVLFRGELIVVAGGLFVFFSLGMQPIENSLVAFLTPPKWRSVSYGIKFTLLFGIGSFAVKLVGFIEGRYGLENVLWLVCIFLGLIIMNTTIFLRMSRGHPMHQVRG